MAKNKKYGHIMIDLETLGTRADSVIISIGAVKFDISGDISDKGFYSSVSVKSNDEKALRHQSEDTLIWWMGQEPEARKVFTEPKTTLDVALHDLADYIDHPDYQVWGNGSDFDIAMLTHAFGTHDIEVPWKFWNVRCFRTIKNLPGMKNVPAPVNALKHNALHDALFQAKHLQAMWECIGVTP